MPILPLILPLLLVAAAACGETRAPTPAPDGARAAPAPPASAQPPAAQREGILFAINPYDEGGFGLDPIALVTPAGLRDTWSVEADSAFSRRYFAPGTRYGVRVHGRDVGQATVLRQTEPACSERFALADVRLTSPLPAAWEGLASDAFPAAAAQPIVRPLAAGEQQSLAALADSIHASHRVPSAARAAGEAERLFAVTVPGADGPVLVGTFNVTVPRDDGSTVTYNQFLVAEAGHGGPHRPAYVWHDRDDADNGVRSLLDAADLDGDGVPELVVRAMYSEAWGYSVLRRGADGWTEVFQGGGGGGC